jgi:hypothetical protein
LIEKRGGSSVVVFSENDPLQESLELLQFSNSTAAEAWHQVSDEAATTCATEMPSAVEWLKSKCWITPTSEIDYGRA